MKNSWPSLVAAASSVLCFELQLESVLDLELDNGDDDDDDDEIEVRNNVMSLTLNCS